MSWTTNQNKAAVCGLVSQPIMSAILLDSCGPTVPLWQSDVGDSSRLGCISSC